ncbi:MAG TPA: DUF4333 domain-containing protein [Actinokineospora sp.]|jgi:hypothetical protein|nr:DUF4333 domain-containing protein [Actinokineospora sp.]
MSSPYGPSGGNDPQQQWGQQPYGGGPTPGTPSGGFPAQPGGYPPPQNPYGQPGGYPQQPQQPQPTQQYPTGGGYPPPQQPNPYGQPPGGYPQQPMGGYPGTPAKKGSSAWIWILVTVAVLAVGAVGVLGFITPGWFNTKVFDQAAVEAGVKSILTDKYNIEKVESVTCPANQEVKKDLQFTCEAKIDGEVRKVNITVKTDTDGQYEVAPPADK